MGFKCGIVGLPNVGKSTLFNALTETAAAQAANYPFTTIEPNVGDVAVPDPRLATARGNRRFEGDRSDPAHVRRHRRARARRLEGRGARQSVSRQYSRMRRDRPCRALFRGRRRHACRRPHRPVVRHRHDRDRIDARRSRKPRAPHCGNGEEGEGRRQGGQGPAGARGSEPRRAQGRPPRARRRRRARGTPPLPVARPALVEAGHVCLQRRRGLGRPRERLFRSGQGAGGQGRRGGGGRLGEDRERDRRLACRASRRPTSRRSD